MNSLGKTVLPQGAKISRANGQAVSGKSSAKLARGRSLSFRKNKPVSNPCQAEVAGLL